jgi:hypothetical protein
MSKLAPGIALGEIETAGVNIESIGGYWIDDAFGRDFPDLAEQAGARRPV